ncbi:MAG: Uma2 family endonuclease [Clostridia bacterium]|nr:Uma2 family endonuclease [Deltaproteobacteria bacterium]
MTSIAKRHATYDDIAALPDNFVGEIVYGDLLVSPRPSGVHSIAASALGFELGPPFSKGRGGPGGWWILDEPELHLGAHVLVPDIAGWLRSDLSTLDIDRPSFAIPPRWVCEILSPATARYDRLTKLDAYHAERVSWAWIVDPLQRSVEVFRSESAGWLRVQTVEGATEAKVAPFDAVAIDLATLWLPSS